MGPGDAGCVSAERLASELQMFGLDCEEAAYEKLAELCPLYRRTEDQLVAELVAFSNNTGKVYLTLENLASFENEFLNKRRAKARHGATKKDSGHQGTWDIVSIQELIEVEAKEETLLNSYTTPSKGSQKRSVSTPETPQSKRNVSATRSPHLLFSPSSFSPSATPSQKYSSRSNRGEIVTSFGSTQGMSWSGKGGSGSLRVKVLDASRAITGPYKSMFQKLSDIREVLTCRIEELGCELKELHKIEAFSPISVPAQEPVTLLGQIGCDSNGKLNPKSVILEGDREHSLGVQIPVDLSELKEYSLFPGQVVVMEGTNTTGKKFIATKLYEGVPLPFYQPTEEDGDSEQRMILVACGPYMTSDSVTYDPMIDLMSVINRDQPDVCILLGPFLDAKHEQVENCQLTTTYEDVFRKYLWMVIEGTRSSGTHLVFIPSLRDVHHQPVYPQPPFSFPELQKEDQKRVHFVSDPCSLSINGVILGLTSTDLLFHMGAEEISSYYPLYPPFEDTSLDLEHFYSHAQLPVTPDILIIPSELRYFVKDILGCVCMNPGRLTKGQVGGTFGRLYISRQPAHTSERKSPCTAAQVVKI
ncbi:DNA polymerase alpha subunit B isoform X1 [Petaurus breviceps papuanus]|uniref:DNA polymerase alpha subunit B isoform X1 n=1 Tax=Petaurus breviceps papuanus TaxID=3040969 RepID=UPI0036DDA213